MIWSSSSSSSSLFLIKERNVCIHSAMGSLQCPLLRETHWNQRALHKEMSLSDNAGWIIALLCLSGAVGNMNPWLECCVQSASPRLACWKWVTMSLPAGSSLCCLLQHQNEPPEEMGAITAETTLRGPSALRTRGPGHCITQNHHQAAYSNPGLLSKSKKLELHHLPDGHEGGWSTPALP